MSALTPFSRNAVSYWPRPRLCSHPPTSTTVSSGQVMLEADYCAGVLLLSRRRHTVGISQFRPTAGKAEHGQRRAVEDGAIAEVHPAPERRKRSSGGTKARNH